MTNGQKTVVGILIGIAVLELALIGRFAKIWHLAFSPTSATPAAPPTPTNIPGGGIGQAKVPGGPVNA